MNLVPKDYTELLFAAAVRDLASTLESHTRITLFIGVTPDDPVKWKEVTEWMEKNPVTNFVPAALAEIKKVAMMISAAS